MSAQNDRHYNDEPRLYIPRGIVNPWRITVIGIRGRKFGLGFYIPSEDLHIAEDLEEVREEIGRLEFPGRVLALARKPYFLGLNKREEDYIRKARIDILNEVKIRRTEFS